MNGRVGIPHGLLVVIGGGLGAFLVHATIVTVAPATPGAVRLTFVVAAAIASALVIAIATRWLVGAPLRRMLHAIYRMSEGDLAVRTGARGVGLTAELLQGLDDLAGRLEARCEAARASEARYRRLFEHSPAGLFWTRPDGRVLDCNPAAVRMLGYASVAEAKTRNARAFYANPADRDRLLDRLRGESLVTNEPMALRAKDGRVIPVLLTVQRTDGAEGTSLDGQFLDARHLALDVSSRDAEDEPIATVGSR